MDVCAVGRAAEGVLDVFSSTMRLLTRFAQESCVCIIVHSTLEMIAMQNLSQ